LFVQNYRTSQSLLKRHLFDRDSSNNNEYFGLKNIDDRIKLFYGYDYGIKITSIHMKSTTVCILIPAIEDLNDNMF